MDSKGRKFFFGKYKGKYINDIIVNDTQYITWSMKNIDWFWYNHDKVEINEEDILPAEEAEKLEENEVQDVKAEEVVIKKSTKKTKSKKGGNK